MIQIQLCGAAALLLPGAVRQPLDRHGALIAARLALAGPQPRALLAAMLWPDVAEARARANLRQRLLRLKALAGRDWIEGDGVLVLHAHVAVLPLDDPAAADLLEGVPAPASDELSRWLDVARAGVRQRRLSVLAARIDAAERAHDSAAAVHAAQRVVELDPLSEEPHRQLMRLHYLADDAGRARAAYEQLRQMLAREFGAEPGAQTRELLQLIQRGEQRELRPRVAPAASAALLRPPQLLGRDDALAAIRAHLAPGAPVLVVGEAGIGKSRLLAELHRTAGNNGCLSVAARPGEEGLAFGLAARCLRAIGAWAPFASAAAGVAPARTTLAPLVPEWADSSTLPLPVAELPRLLMAARELLRTACGGGLRVVLVDDLHHADGASIDLLLPLLDDAACSWLLALRPDEGAAAGHAPLQGLATRAGTLCWRLQVLEPSAVRLLLDTLDLPGLTGAGHAEALHRHTGGNPLFLLETLKAWQAAPDTGGGWPRATSVLRLIQQRLARLSPLAIKVARCAAVAGPELSAARVARLLALHPLDLADAWGQLETAQVLRGDRFAHDLIEQAVHGTVPGAIARPLHAALAQLLAHEEAEPVRVAAHWLAASQTVLAVPFLAHAGRRAAALGRHAEAAALHQQAAGLYEDAGQAAAAFDAWFAAADHFSELDDKANVMRCAARLEALAAGDDQEACLACVKVYLLFEKRQLESAQACIRNGLDKARRAGLKDIEVELLWNQTVIAWDTGRVADALLPAEAALAILPTVDRTRARLALRGTELKLTTAIGLIASAMGQLEHGRFHLERALELSTQASDHGQVLTVAGALLNLAHALGDAHGMALWDAQCASAGERLRAEGRPWDAWVWSRRRPALMARAEFGLALRLAEQAQANGGLSVDRYGIASEIDVYLLQHELGRADLAAKGLRAMRARDDLLQPQWLRVHAALLHVGEKADAARVLADYRTIEDPHAQARLLCEAEPGCAPEMVLPHLLEGAARALELGAHGRCLSLQTHTLAALRRLGGDDVRRRTLALALHQSLERGLVGFDTYPAVAAELCAALADSDPGLSETIAMRAVAWMLNAAATLPPAWRTSYLTRAPFLGVLPAPSRARLARRIAVA